MRIVLLSFLALSPIILQAAAAPSAESALVDRYFGDYFQLNPSNGTAAGFHGAYDAQLEDYSAAGYRKRVALSARYLPLFEQLPRSSDRDLMISHLHAELVNLQDIHQQETNPDIYSGGITASIFGLISRQFAPINQRLLDVIEREKLIPQALQEARLNLRNCPEIYTRVAIEQLPGIVDFFRKDVPAAFAEVSGKDQMREFRAENSAVIEALQKYQAWLQQDLLPRSKGDFRIGAENYSQKVKYEEMVDLPLPKLVEVGYANLRQNQRALQEVCRKMHPQQTTREVVDNLSKDHPGAGQLLQSFRDTFSDLITFIDSHRIVTIPTTTRPLVEETPPFMRALTTASMDTPGPYEKVATESYFNVTLPEESWSGREKEEFMSGFSRGTILSTAIHEAYPGHFVQLLWFQRVHSKVRRLINANSTVEGWAHYTEQMMLDQGYGNNDPELRAGQLVDALLRNARYIVGIEMHTGKRTFDQGVQFFMQEAYLSHENAERETKRGTSDPTYLVYTLGKLEILKLRADYQKKMGAAYTLEDFHNRFMQNGGVPVKLIRQAMLGDDSPIL